MKAPIPRLLASSTHLFASGGKYEHALAPCFIQVLELAMNLPGVRSPLTPQQRARMTRRVIEPQLHERATIYLLLAHVLSRLSTLLDAPEAKKVCAGLLAVRPQVATLTP